MSLFHFSCSRQEIQAALEYFSANSSTLPASVHQFHQTLQTQIIAANSTSRTSLQANIHPLPTPSPSPPRTLGVGESHLPHAPLFLTTSAPWIHTTDEVQRRDADNPSVPLPSAYSGDPVDALLSGDKIQSRDFLSSQYAKRLDVNDLILSNNEGWEKTDLVGPTDTVGLLGNTIFSGEHTEAGKSLQEDNSTNKMEKKVEAVKGVDVVRVGAIRVAIKVEVLGVAGEEAADVAQAAPEMEATSKGGLGRELQPVQDYGYDKGSGEGLGGGSSEGFGASDCSFVHSPIRASASKAVQEETSLLLLTLYSTPESLDWIPEFLSALKGEPWAELDALTTESLKNLALHCAWSKSMSLVGTFCRMLNELMFAAKVNRVKDLEEENWESDSAQDLELIKTEGTLEAALSSVWAPTQSSTQIGMVYYIKEMEMAGWTILGLVPAWGYRQHHPSTLAEKTMLHAVEAFPVYGLEEMKEGLTLGYLQKCVMSTKYYLFMQWKRIMYHVDEVLPVYTLGEVKEGLIMYHVDEVFPVYALEEVKEGLWVHHLWNL
ncbi:hypothetical protein EV360DRAFT_75106 [Lentinula raphanica]|nr:hypothetical protein EV360DRAFT_75106 [Lentinula raphanica]